MKRKSFKFKFRSLAQSLVWLGLFSLIFAQPISAQTKVWSGICVQSGVATIQGLQCLIANVFSIAITAIGFAGFVMLIVGAFRYLISGGNSKGTETAKNTITFAIVGLVVALSAFIILNLISAFTGIDTILDFSIPGSEDEL